MRNESNPSISTGNQNYAGDPAVPGASGTTFLNKIPGIPHFSGMKEEKRHCQAKMREFKPVSFIWIGP